jgi:hypothetical protein
VRWMEPLSSSKRARGTRVEPSDDNPLLRFVLRIAEPLYAERVERRTGLRQAQPAAVDFGQTRDELSGGISLPSSDAGQVREQLLRCVSVSMSHASMGYVEAMAWRWRGDRSFEGLARVFMCSKHEVCVTSRQHGRVYAGSLKVRLCRTGRRQSESTEAVRFSVRGALVFRCRGNQAPLVAFSVCAQHGRCLVGASPAERRPS